MSKQNNNTKRLSDRFYNAAKDQGFLARSVFKLQEIQNKYRLFPVNKDRKKSFYVLDLGCSPGSWLQFSSSILNNNDKIIGIDISEAKIQNPKITFIQKSIFNIDADELFSLIDNNKFDLVLSDMAPKTCGIRLLDQQRSLELCEQALNIGIKVLKPNGNMLVKIFQSPDTHNYVNNVKKIFKKVRRVKPESSKKESYEMYILATGFLSNEMDNQS